jgi:hypothetical protein
MSFGYLSRFLVGKAKAKEKNYHSLLPHKTFRRFPFSYILWAASLNTLLSVASYGR